LFADDVPDEVGCNADERGWTECGSRVDDLMWKWSLSKLDNVGVVGFAVDWSIGVGINGSTHNSQTTKCQGREGCIRIDRRGAVVANNLLIIQIE